MSATGAATGPMSPARFGLSDAVMADLQAALRQCPWVLQAWIFGSRAKGNFRDGSDIDLAVSGTPDETGGVAQLWDRLESLPVLFKIDLVHVDSIDNPVLKERIAAEGIPIYTAD